jgi:hypothetical protein
MPFVDSEGEENGAEFFEDVFTAEFLNTDLLVIFGTSEKRAFGK